jgi:hypothetical protein
VKKMTRRQLGLRVAVGTAAGVIAAIPVLAQQAPGQAPQAATPDWDGIARADHLQASRDIAKVELPMLVEPAFQFKA